MKLSVSLLFTTLVQAGAGAGAGCHCDILKLTENNSVSPRLDPTSSPLGIFNKVRGVEVSGRPVWLHENENFFLYYSNKSAMWGVGLVLGGDVATLENKGDVDRCPSDLRTPWRRGDSSASMKMLCLTGPCAGYHCGPNAECQARTQTCVCKASYSGDPYKRCFPSVGSLCNCKEISLTTTNTESLRNQQESFGSYFLYGSNGGYPVYQHQQGSLYLYHQDGSWLISNKIGSRSGGVQNQGDPSMCPYRFKTAWEYADVRRSGWQWSYDYSARMVCPEDGCSVTKCGQGATCTDIGGEGSCSCDIGYDGNPYTRCYPVNVPQDCPCTRITVSSSAQAADTQSDKMGTYYLYGYHNNRVVYQHQSGLEYLFHAHGQAWAIGASIGGLRVGIINFSNLTCPYKVDSTWKYSTQGKLDDDESLTVVCRKNSIIQNPISPETPAVTTTTITSRVSPAAGESLQSLYQNYVKLDSTTTEHSEVTTHLEGIHSVNTGDKGIIRVHNLLEERERPTKIQDLKIRGQDSFPGQFFQRVSNDLYEQNDLQSHSEDIEDQESGESYKIYLVTTPSPAQNLIKPNYFETKPPKTRNPRTPTPILRSPPFVPTTAIPNLASSTTTRKIQDFLNQLGIKTTVTSQSKSKKKQTLPLHPAYTSLPIDYDQTEGQLLVSKMREKVAETVTEADNERVQLIKDLREEAEKVLQREKFRDQVMEKLDGSKDRDTDRIRDEGKEKRSEYRGPCNCSKIIMTSNNPTTISKHGAELGQYNLIGSLHDRPVYRHDSRQFYLFYQPQSGGNWLVNTKPGLLYGGIQNSKDVPNCPYLVSTVWQYGDSEVGGWVYDQSLTVTCPSNPCSVLKCGFRAECVREGEGDASCQCKEGFVGDPYSRCYPEIKQGRCGCHHLQVSSMGPARLHQRDKMGDYFLWGYFNNHPVYQHYSGLDFLYFHTNMVWGVGPKVGGKRAGLLNFASVDCPYEVTSPWQFGTKLPNKGRQLDTHMTVTCANQ